MSTGILSSEQKTTLDSYSDIISRDIVYRDLDLTLIPHPITGAIATLQDVDAVKRALVNLILTEPNERPFQPNVGTPIRKFLFDLTGFNNLNVTDQIMRSVQMNEPRVTITNINIDSVNSTNSLLLDITFRIRNIPQIQRIEILLNRVR